MKGLVFNIQRLCVHDGPGIRTTVFFKGCPLRCAWCHNPESQRMHPELLYAFQDCIGCGNCVTACPKHLHTIDLSGHQFDRTACIACGACAESCPIGALEKCGRMMETDEVLAQVLRDSEFYRASGGGLTLSGGEPMAQNAFALELAVKAKEAGLHVCIETCGCCSWESLKRMLPYADLFLYDFKLSDSEMHMRYTGVDNALIAENLGRLCEAGADIILRCPIIPKVNLTREHFEDIADVVRTHPGILEIDLEPYHPLGISKSLRLGRPASYREEMPLDSEAIEEYAQVLKSSLKLPVVYVL